jgi:HK97 family phage major capsid protein
LIWPNVNQILTVGGLVDFDKYLDGMQLIEATNLTPNAVVNSPKNNNTLRKLTSGIAGDKSKLAAPEEYLALQRFVTTSMPDTSAIIGDFTNALFGMRESVVIEATRVGENALKNVQILIRGYMRLDTGLTRAKAFTRLMGIT